MPTHFQFHSLTTGMPVTRQESHQISVYAGQGEVAKLRSLVHDLAEREGMTTAEVLLASKDDYHQTAAHIAAKAGQTRTRSASFCFSFFPGKKPPL